MNHGNPSANANAWQSNNNGQLSQARGVSLPGGLPPTPQMANQPRSQQSGTAQVQGNPGNNSNSGGQDAPFQELGRAGSLLGWVLDYVSPRTSNAQDGLSATDSATGNLLMHLSVTDLRAK
jgi:hypothetical protein